MVGHDRLRAAQALCDIHRWPFEYSPSGLDRDHVMQHEPLTAAEQKAHGH